jgi:hypothetical protein
MLSIGVYEVGQIPSRPLVVLLKDEGGQNLDLSGYTNVRFRMKGSRNEDVDLIGSDVQIMDRRGGRVALHFAKDHSVFTNPGDYVFDVELSGPSARDYTTSGTIRVTQLGGTK